MGINMNKVEAKERGLTQYDGSACGKCGSTTRRTCNGGCHACHVHRLAVREQPGGDRYEYKLARNIKARNARKTKVFDHYGRNCELCGYDDMRALTIDHTNQDGASHKKSDTSRRLGGDHLRRWLISNKFPPGFRTLCCNCQSIQFAIFEGRDADGSGGKRLVGNLMRNAQKKGRI